jgi:hypothetical protein
LASVFFNEKTERQDAKAEKQGLSLLVWFLKIVFSLIIVAVEGLISLTKALYSSYKNRQKK